MVTSFQNTRISFHLGFTSVYDFSQLNILNNIRTLTADQELMVLGLLEDQPETDLIYISGQLVCNRKSLLGNVELAYEKLNSDTIEESLFVSSAGSAKLRGNELDNRMELYNAQVEFLAVALGAVVKSGRVGD